MPLDQVGVVSDQKDMVYIPGCPLYPGRYLDHNLHRKHCRRLAVKTRLDKLCILASWDDPGIDLVKKITINPKTNAHNIFIWQNNHLN